MLWRKLGLLLVSLMLFLSIWLGCIFDYIFRGHSQYPLCAFLYIAFYSHYAIGRTLLSKGYLCDTLCYATHCGTTIFPFSDGFFCALATLLIASFFCRRCAGVSFYADIGRYGGYL